MKVPGVDALREALTALNLDARGRKPELKKRLRNARKRRDLQSGPPNGSTTDRRAAASRPSTQDFDSFLVLDFEATCQRYEESHGSFFGFPNEIIEFPVMLLQWRRKGDDDGDESESSSIWTASSTSSCSDDDRQSRNDNAWELVVVDEFRRFVRPTWRPQLSAFCTELTGITQKQVDSAQVFVDVLDDFKTSFADEYGLFPKSNKTAWVTDGPWDLRDFVSKQCYISGIDRPNWLRGPYVDLRSSATAYLARGKPVETVMALGPTKEKRESAFIPASQLPIDVPIMHLANADESISTSPDAPSDSGVFTTVTTTPTTRALGSANIPAVLAALNLEPFQGRQHSGIDDVRNIARILQELVRPERKWTICANAVIDDKERRWSWMKKDGRVAWKHPPAL